MHVPLHADRTQAREHRIFVASYLSTGIAALAALPLYLAFAPEVSGPGALATSLLSLPLVIALYAMHTGAVGRSHSLAVVAAGLMLFALAATTGGFTSPVLPSLALVLGLGFALGSARTRTAVIATSVAIVITFTAGGLAGVLVPYRLDALLPVPAWMVGALIAFPSLLHAAVWVHATRIAEEEAAQNSRGEIDRHQKILDNAADLVTLHNRAGNLVHASQAARRLLGIDPAALKDAGLFNRVHVADRPAYLRLLDMAHAAREPEAADVRIRVGDIGEGAPVYAWFEMRCRAVGAGEDTVVVLREANERKAQEEKMDSAIEEAERAGVMKTRFLASVSHELRTPLNAIIGFSEVLEQELFGKFEYEKHREYAGLIHQSGRHLLEVVNDILDMSKIEAGKFEIVPEPFNIEQILKDCVAMLGPRAREKGVSLKFAIEPHLPDLNADSRAMRQICLNLLSNAIKFTREDTAQGESEVMLTARRRGDRIELAVRDNGIGIAAEDIEHVGEPFFQAQSSYDRRYEGTGLGLSVVRGLVRLHGGRFEVDSKLGQGTTVTITVPIEGPAANGAGDPRPVNVQTLPRQEIRAGRARKTVAEDLALAAPFARKAG